MMSIDGIASRSEQWHQMNRQALWQGTQRIKQALEYFQEHQQPLALEPPQWPEQSAIATLQTQFDLSIAEIDILLLCVAQEIDPAIAPLCGQIRGNPGLNSPNLMLAMSVLSHAEFNILSPQKPLLRWQLITLETHHTLTRATLKLSQRVLCYLLGEAALDPELQGWVVPLPREQCTPTLPPSQAAIAQEVRQAWSQGQYPLIQLCSTERTAQYSIAAVIARSLNWQVQTLLASTLPTAPTECYRLQQKWLREARLSRAVLLIEAHNATLEQLQAIALFLRGLTVPLILCTEQRQRLGDRAMLTFEIPNLPHPEKRHLWEQYLGDQAAELNGHLEPLIAQFNLSSHGIQAACAAVQNTPLPDLPAQLWQYCRSQARPQLDHLAQRIPCTATWEDLILPEREKAILQTIALQVQHRTRVYEQWGFSQKSARGLGITALFAGASGTGKTMAAEVLAQAFKLDLYCIDLSAVSSKYIGETEKNLRTIFDAAESGGAVLLFDEADALFGKRTQVKDSRDRHANLGVSYLLQRMEAYQGLAILTTNLKDALDQAFFRRLRFVVNFPYPDKTLRQAIWANVFPKQTQTQRLDFELLAQLDVAGGNIRAIALNAAFLAASANEPIRMQHLLQATQTEYLKTGKVLTSSEIQNWV